MIDPNPILSLIKHRTKCLAQTRQSSLKHYFLPDFFLATWYGNMILQTKYGNAILQTKHCSKVNTRNARYKNASNWCSGNMGDVVAPDFTEPESLSLSHLCRHDIFRISARYLMQGQGLVKMTWSPTSDLTLISFEKSIMVMTKKCKSTKKELLCKR